MRLPPQSCRNGKRVDTLGLPPQAFIAAPMQFAMMESAQRNGEPVTDLAPHGFEFGKLDVVSI
jgi:hypothetical protein